MDRFGVDCALKRRLRRSRQPNEGRHVDLALYARVWGRRLPERRSHPDGARQAAPAPVAKSNVAGPERRAAPGRPPLFCAWSSLASRQCLRFTLPRRAIVLLPKLSSLKPVSAAHRPSARHVPSPRHSALKTRVNALTTGRGHNGVPRQEPLTPSLFPPCFACGAREQTEPAFVAHAGPAPIGTSGKAMSSSLLMTRRFAPLFWTQFFAAFSDNFLKTSLVFLLLFHIGGADAEALITLAAAVFIAPYFFLSALGGELADRYDKAKVAQRLKLTEIGIAFIAVIGFGLHSLLLLFFALFLFGVIAALFGPIKYGILPDHLARSELPSGNALVEGATFIAILLGTIVGGMAAKDGGDPAHFAFLMLVFSLLCWGASLRHLQSTDNKARGDRLDAESAALLSFFLFHHDDPTELSIDVQGVGN